VGPSIVGRTVEVQSDTPYAEYQERHVLGPLGMTSSAWLMNDRLRSRLAKGMMRIARGDGTYFFDAAPEFELGTIPAGNLYTTAPDLARFAAWVMGSETNGDSGDSTAAVLPRAALDKMLVPQLTSDATGFGLGFYVGNYRGHKTAQHMGAVYGFTTSMVVLPGERIGVVVLSNADIAMAPVRRLTDAALNLLLEIVREEPPPEAPKSIDVASEALAQFAGQYESLSYWAELKVEGGSLAGTLSGQPITLRPVGPSKFLADGRIMNESEFSFDRADDGRVTGFSATDQKFRRVDARQSQAPPPAWQQFAGSYGLPFIPLVLSTRLGHLYATVENEYDYRLTPINRVTFGLPPGMYSDEQIVVQTDAGGRAVAVVMANMVLPRRAD
jgi:hypothetical protein